MLEPGATIAFGRFQLLPHRRELLADGQPVKLGGRAFDVLMALIEAREAVVSKDALMARVWPEQVVEENNLHTHISDLRSAFGADRGLIRTVAGRGYQFTGDISLVLPTENERRSPVVAATASAPALPPTNLPKPASELIGREDELREIVRLAAEHRLLTLTGPGGIGKTRLALEAARTLLPHFPDGAWLAEFSPISDAGLVPATVAAAAEIEPSGGKSSAQHLAQALAERPLLLVLDTCEHVIGATAQLAEAMLRTGSAVHIIATSREPLRAEGEQIYVVPPLAVPASVGEDLCEYSAVRLFAVRARASGADIPKDQQVASAIVAICRQLDGIPLAIEFAAARAATFGIKGIAALLGDRFHLLGGGRRTALPRHQTLRAMLDWSYELLSDPERVILHRLGIFAGLFRLEAVSSVAGCAEISLPEVIEGVANLTAKSLVVTELKGQVARYRLLDTTRAYVLEKLRESGEFEAVARRHAQYYRHLFEQAEADWQTRPAVEWLADYGHHIDNLRAALDWAFSPNGDVEIGIALTAAAVPLWMHLSLIDECRDRIEKALAALGNGANPDPRREMKLQVALGTALINTRGAASPDIAAAWTKALELAESFGDAEYQLRSLWGLWTFNLNAAGARAALTFAQRFSALAAERLDPNDRLVGERITGVAHFYLGDQRSVRRHLERVLADEITPERGAHLLGLQSGPRVGARVLLAWSLRLQGFPEQAMRTAESSVEEARKTGHALSLCFALALGAFPIALWVGDLLAAEQYLETLLDYSIKHALIGWRDFGRCLRGALLIRRGDVVTGLQLLSAGITEHGGTRISAFWYVMSRGILGAALGHAGQVAEGLATIDAALTWTEQSEECWMIAELLRMKGELLLLQGPVGAATAEDLFRQALDWARRQGALSWELRAATSLARLLRDRGRSADARGLLQPVYDRLSEGFGTADLKAARALLDALRES